MAADEFYFRFPIFCVLFNPRNGPSGFSIDGFAKVDVDEGSAFLLLTDRDLAERAKRETGVPTAEIMELKSPMHAQDFLGMLAVSGVKFVAIDHFEKGQVPKYAPINQFIAALRAFKPQN